MLTPRRLAAGFGLAFALAYAGTAAAYRTRFVADNCATTRLPHQRRTSPATARPRSLCARPPRGIPVGPADAGTTTTATTRRATRARIRTPAARAATARLRSRSGARRSTRVTPASCSGDCCASSMARTRPLRSRPAPAPRASRCEVGPREDGRARERRPHRVDLRGEPRRQRSDHRGEGEAYGTNIWTRTLSGSSSYSGVRRTGWNS